jgi:membrane associated rhomboid family serine protease
MENQNSNFNDYNELDDLRRQINDLKQKVDQQGRLNEDLVKKTIQGKMKGVHNMIFKLGFVAVACIPLYIMMKYQVGLSWPLIIFTIIFMLASLTSDYFINRMDVSHMGDDLVETANKLIKMKKNRVIGQRIGIGVAILWLAWFCYEYFMLNLPYGTAAAWGSIVGIFVGAIIGGLIGLRIFNKMQRANDEMIDQINELTREQ